MSDYESCPNCGRKTETNILSNWFAIHTCKDCGKKYCNECGLGNGTHCPECESTIFSDYDIVYEKE